MNEGPSLFLNKTYTHVFISRNGSNSLSVIERQGVEERREYCYIDLFLTNVELLNSGPHLALFLLPLREVLNRGRTPPPREHPNRSL